MRKEYIKLAVIGAFLHEIFFSIPVLGFFTAWGSSIIFPLFSGLVLHSTVLYALKNQQQSLHIAPRLGLVASFLGFVPVIGWLLHVVAALLYLGVVGSVFGIDVIQGHKRRSESQTKHKSTAKDEGAVRDAEIVE